MNEFGGLVGGLARRNSYGFLIPPSPIPHGNLTASFPICSLQLPGLGMLQKAETMVEILRFDEALQRRVRPQPAKTADDSFSFWPEVSSGLWVTGTQTPVDPANSQGRVLFEILLILGATAAIAVAISLLTGAPYGM